MPTHDEKTKQILEFIRTLKDSDPSVQERVAQELSDHPLSWKQIKKIRSIVGLSFYEDVC